MGIFKEERFIKDKKGCWKKTKEQIVKAPHDLGRWERSAELDNKTNGKYFTIYQADVTKSGLGKKVTRIVSGFGCNEKVEYNLITTTSKLGKSDYEKYRHIKGADCPIKR